MLKIKNKLNKKDLFNFSLYNLKHNKILLISIFFITIIIIYIKNKNNISDPSLILYFLEFIITYIIIFLLLAGLSLLSINTSNNKKFLSEKIYEITEKEIITYWNEAKIAIKWKEFYKLKENKQYFYWYINTKQAIIITKRNMNKNDLIILYKLLKKIKKQIKK